MDRTTDQPDPVATFLARVRAVHAQPEEDLLLSCLVPIEEARRILLRHPTLTGYTLQARAGAGDVWVRQGLREPAHEGCVVGLVDLGAGFAQMLFADEPAEPAPN